MAMSKVFFSPEPLIFTLGGGEPGHSMDTVDNVANAIALGSDVVLNNVSLTADNSMVIHSRDVFHNPGIRLRGIETHTRKELVELFDGSDPGDQRGTGGQLFPELRSILDTFPSQRFLFILNGTTLRFAEIFLEILSGSKAGNRVLVSASGKMMKKIRGRMPDIATTFTFTGVLGFYALYRSGLISARRHFNGDALMLPETIGVSYIASPGVVEAARKRGLRVYLLDVNDENSIRRFLDSGANGFITGNVPLVKALLPKKQPE